MTTIFISTYKNNTLDKLPNYDGYTPIQVGYDDDCGCLRDNTGDNISKLNNRYAELTAFYWAWKNYKDDYIGHYQYRRLLDINNKDIPKALSNYDIIVGEPLLVSEPSIAAQYLVNHGKDNWHILMDELNKRKYDISYFYKTRKLYYSNLCVMSYENYCKYCAWLFDIIDNIKDRVILYNDWYQGLVFTFMAERLLNFYIHTNNMKAYECRVLFNKEI